VKACGAISYNRRAILGAGWVQICRSAERYTPRGSFAKATIPAEVARSPIPEGQNILQKGEI